MNKLQLGAPTSAPSFRSLWFPVVKLMFNLTLLIHHVALVVRSEPDWAGLLRQVLAVGEAVYAVWRIVAQWFHTRKSGPPRNTGIEPPFHP